jgi:L-amino acid N-acyltransferase YncA
VPQANRDGSAEKSAQHGGSPSIRSAVESDLGQVAAIYAHYVESTVVTFDQAVPTKQAWQERLRTLAARSMPFLVAEAENEIVGYAFAAPWRPKPSYLHTVEDSIYLAPTWTGKGVGRLLMGPLLAGCETAGAREVLAVIADTGDPASTALHLSFGFREVGRLTGVGYKFGSWIDTVLLQRSMSR